MRARIVALCLLLAAAAVHFSVTSRQRAALERAENEQRRLRGERRDMARRLVPAERLEAERQRAIALLAAAPPAEGREAQWMRQTILSRLAGVPVRGLHVSVQPGRGSAGGVASVSCEGSLETILKASSELLRPGSGFVVSRARLAPTSVGMLLELDATTLRSRK